LEERRGILAQNISSLKNPDFRPQVLNNQAEHRARTKNKTAKTMEGTPFAIKKVMLMV